LHPGQTSNSVITLIALSAWLDPAVQGGIHEAIRSCQGCDCDFLFCPVASLFGQSERGTVTGSTVAAVPQAKITATETGTNIAVTSQSNETGDHTLPNLPTSLSADAVLDMALTSVNVLGNCLASAVVVIFHFIPQLWG
jgi:hypothetical protein